MFANRLQIVSSPAWQCAVTQIANAEIRQAGFDAKAGAERRPAHRDREPERAIEMNPRPLAPEDCSCVDERPWASINRPFWPILRHLRR